MARDLPALIAQLDLDEKCAMLAGADLWSTVAIDRLGIPKVGLTDGPNGARGPSVPELAGDGPTLTAACLPSGTALGATWDVELVQRVGAVIGEEARTKASRVLLAPTVNLHRSPLAGRNFESYAEDPVLAGTMAAAFVRGAQSAGVACTVKHFAGNESEDDRFVADSIIDERTLREVHLLPFELAVRDGGALGIMTSYNRLNGEHCADSRWLLTEVLRGDWGFEGFVVSDWFALADTESAIDAGLDLEMPGPGRAYGPALAAAVRDGRVDEHLVDEALGRLLGVLDRVGALDDAPAEPRAEDRPEHRSVARQAATDAMVLLRNDGVLPLERGALRRVAVIGPNADRACIMGGGSASLAVHHRRTPLDALRDRLGAEVEVVFEPGVDISLTTPAVPGSWLHADGEDGLIVEVLGTVGEPLGTARTADGSLIWFLVPPAGAVAPFTAVGRGELRVPEPGRWTLSLVQTDPSTLRVDGETVLDGTVGVLPAGHELLGLASRELTVDMELSPDRPVLVEVETRVEQAGLVMGAKVGIRRAAPVDGVERAVAAAAEADAVVVVVGTDGNWESEGSDRTSMALPGGQDDLVARVLEVAPRAAVVLNTGSVVTVPWADRAGAVLQSWFGGQEMAEALVDVLLGDREPGGRLPTTVPVALQDNPSWGNFPHEDGRTLYGERTLVGHRWYESRGLPVTFPFGHGLGYTSFSIGAPGLSSATLDQGGRLVVSVPVTNTGSRPGSEVVQLYVAAPPGRTTRAPKELKAFAKVALRPGESAVVDLHLGGRAFARWRSADPDLEVLAARLATQVAWVTPPTGLGPSGWVVEPGRYTLLVGRSSADIAHRVEIEVADGWVDEPTTPW